MTIEKAKNVPPFVRFCAASVPMVFDNSMSYYECLCALTKFLQEDVINVINYNADQLEGLIGKYDELKAYVDNYFANLDVQEEINNKLDDMADKGELATIIAQFLAAAPVFGYDNIAAMAAATNLTNGCIARVLGNTSATTGDGAYYKVRTIGAGEAADGYYKVAITADPTLIAIRITDYADDQLDAKIKDVANDSFNQVKLYENLIFNGTSQESFQGSCVDDNSVMYQYVSHEYDSPASEYGTIYKFNILNHTYIGKIENVPMYHGNTLVYDNGYIWASATLHDGNPSNKIVKYNLSDGTSEEFTPFLSTFMVRTSALTTYNDKLMVCGSLSGNDLSSMNFALVDKSTMLYQAYTLQNPKHYNIGYNVIAGMTYTDGKLYILTDGDDLIFELIPDDTNYTLTINKVYELPDQNDMYLEVGEWQGITALPEAYYGKKSFIVASFMNSSAGSPNRITCLNVNNLNLESDLCPTAHPLDNQFYPFKLTYIHVAKNGGSNLVEDGTSDHPFKTIGRAIEYANAIKAAGRTVAEIYIDDNETYDIGNLANLEFVINSNDYVPSLYIGTLTNCTVTIKGNTNINLYKLSNASAIYLNYQTRLFLENASVYDNLSASRNSGVYSNSLTVEYSGQDWFTMSNCCEARLNVVSADNVTRYVVSNRNSSLLLINSDMSSKVYTDRNAYTITGTA